MSDNGDLKLIATLDENSSEAEILKAIKILNGRLKSNANAKIKLDSELDVKSVQKVIKKLETLLNSKNLSVNTKDSIISIQKEAEAMLGVVSSANKASKEKLEFANANKKVAESANNTSKAIANERNAMQSLDDLDYILRNINMQGKTGNSVFQQFGNTLRDAFYAFTAANLLQDAIYKVIDGGKEAVGTVKELNDAAVSLRMATGDSYNSVKQLMSDYNAMAQELGAVTTSVSEAADEWLRQGHSIEDTNTLITDSMMLSKISNLESADSTKYLTSAMQGYKVAVNDVVGIVDKLSAVDLESATDAGGLAEAMSRTAEGAQIAGISMDRLLGMIATVGEVTQKSMSSIGESYKTVFSRMRDIKDNKLSVIGEDGEIEDLSNVEIVLDSLGIKLRDSNLEFRNFQDVLDDVAGSWDSYSSVQKAAIAKAFSGVRQQENFLVMMENWDKVVKYTDVAANSQGTSTEKFGYYLEGLEAKTNSLKASLENLASTTISDELYGSVLDTTKAIVDMTAKSGILKGALAGLGTSGSMYVFQQLAGYLKNATQEFSNFGEALSMTRNGQVGISEMQNLINLTGGLTQSQTRLLLSTNNLTDSQKAAIIMNQRLAQGLPQITEAEALQQLQTMGVATAQGTATGTTISLTSAMRGLWSTLMANPIVLVTTAVTAGVMAWNHYKQAQEEARQTAIELTNTYKQEKESLDSQIESYKELKQKLDNGNLSTDEARSIKEQLLEIQKSLIDSFGDEASNIDLVNGKYKEQLGLLGELSKEKASEYVKENRSAFETAKKELEKTRSYEVGSIFSYESSKGMSDEQKQLYEYIKSYSDLFEVKRLYDTSTLSNSDYAPTLFVNANADDAKEIIDKFYDDIEKYIKDNNLQLDYDSLQIDLSKVSSDIETDDSLKEYRQIYDEFMKAEIVRNDTLRPLYQQSIQAVEDYNNALSNGEGISEAKANLDSVQQSVQNATGELEGSQDVFNSIFEGINKDAETVYNLNKVFKTDKTVQSYAEQLRGLSDIDLKAINFDNDNTEKGEESFRGLMETLGLTEEQVQSLIDKLVELGYVQGEVQTQSDVESVNIQSFSDAWSNLKSSTDDATKSLADNLTELAEKGQLTSEKLLELDSSDYFKNLGISAEEAVKKINELTNASTQLNALSSQISKMSDMLADKKNGTVASASDLAGFDVEVRGLNSWEEFEKVMGSAESTMEQCQKAANDLATEWVNSNNFLANLDETNKDYYETQLANMGVENAHAVVSNALTQKRKEEALATEYATLALAYNSDAKNNNAQVSDSLSNATANDIVQLIEEGNVSNETAQSLVNYYFEKLNASNLTIATAGDCHNLANLCESLGIAAGALRNYAYAKQVLEAAQTWDDSNPFKKITIENQEKALKNLEEQAKNVVKQATDKQNNPVKVGTTNSNNKKSSGKSGGGSSKDTKKKFSETFDWIEVRIKRLERAISNYDNVIDNTYNSWSKRNKALEKEITKITSLITAQQKAQDIYKKKADKVTVKNTSEDGKSTKKQEEAFKKYKKLVREGSLKISDIKDEDVANAIKKYQEYYEKSLDAQDSKTEAQKQLLDAYVKKFDMVSEKYDSIIGIYDVKKSNWETAYKDNIEAQGRDMNLAETKEYTSKRNSYEQKTQAQLEKERAELRKKQAEAVKKGLRKDSQEYKDMEKAILEVDQALQESKNIVANTAQEIREAAIAEFNETSEKYDSIISIFDANKSTMDSTIKNAIESTGRQMNYGEASTYYNNLNNIQANTQAQLVNEIAELQQKLAQAVENGVDQNSNDYRSMQAELINAQNALQDSKNAVNENTLALLQTKWSDIQKSIDRLDETLSDSEFTRNMISNMGDLYTKSVGSKPTEITGTMTDYGKATLSTYFNDINTNQAKIAKAQEGYKDVLSKLATDPNNDAYKNQANSFKQEIENATLAIYSSKDDIVSLYSDMFNEMLDSLKKISDNTMNQLQTEKDLYDYQKSIREKTDNISLLQRQLNVYKNDTSESGKMNYQQIKSQLEQAKTDLGDTEYSRFLSDTQSLLDQMNDDASDWVEQTLADKTTLITNALGTVDGSIGEVQKIINTVNSSIVGVQNAISNLNSSTPDTNNPTTTDTNKSTTTPVMPSGMDVVPTITLDTPAIIDTGGTILDSKEIANPNKLSTKLAGHPNSIKQGEKNNSFVGLVNQALTKLGYKTNSGNGYGDTTAAAVKKFCQDNKVNIDSKTKKTKASGKTMGNDFFKKLISVLKAKGYSRGGVITDDDFDLSNLGIRTNNGDTKLITVKNGERVLTPIQNQNFEELIKYLQANPIVPNIPTNLVSNIPQAKNVDGNSYSTNIEHVDLSFPDVTNYEDFVQKLKHDNTTLKYIAAQTAGAYVGKNSLKNRL